MSKYKKTLDYLYSRLPMFQRVGGSAYKEGLDNSLALCSHLGNPQDKYKIIHVAGTNGKGSVSNLIAAVLQAQGYKVGLYTSPHLVDFRERIRINGAMIPEDKVVHFVDHIKSYSEEISPSFFELTMAMAFEYFAKEEVDYAVIEVGLGGRLDSTNVVKPILSVITNISFDHIQFLGTSLVQIAGEKAGIIKQRVPVIVGETTDETRPVFVEKAKEMSAPVFFASEEEVIAKSSLLDNAHWLFQTADFGAVEGQLGGLCQDKNAATVFAALRELKQLGVLISDTSVQRGFSQVTQLTGLRGRWEKLRINPKVICDTGHNEAGIQQIVQQLNGEHYNKLRIVLGMVNDKDVTKVLSLLPQNAIYYFTRASIPRSLEERALQQKAFEAGLSGNCYSSVMEAYETALKEADKDDLIFVGGSTFIVADLLTGLQQP
ncbi:MAG: bifunctional folylpolyglutamate synthase/dihydrofolate synthase [Bacteroidales bacterium]